MPNYVLKTDPSKYLLSTDPSETGPGDWLEDPPGLPGLLSSGVQSFYWKLNGGQTDVLEMDAAEKAAVDAAQDAAALASAKTGGINLVDATRSDLGLIVRALAKVMMSEINLLRQQHALADRTFDQLKTSITNEINAET